MAWEFESPPGHQLRMKTVDSGPRFFCFKSDSSGKRFSDGQAGVAGRVAGRERRGAWSGRSDREGCAFCGSMVAGPDVNREQIGGAGRGGAERQSVGRSATVRSCGIFTEARGSGGQGRAQGRRRSEGRGCAGTASEAGPGAGAGGAGAEAPPQAVGPGKGRPETKGGAAGRRVAVKLEQVRGCFPGQGTLSRYDHEAGGKMPFRFSFSGGRFPLPVGMFFDIGEASCRGLQR